MLNKHLYERHRKKAFYDNLTISQNVVMKAGRVSGRVSANSFWPSDVFWLGYVRLGLVVNQSRCHFLNQCLTIIISKIGNIIQWNNLIKSSNLFIQGNVCIWKCSLGNIPSFCSDLQCVKVNFYSSITGRGLMRWTKLQYAFMYCLHR